VVTAPPAAGGFSLVEALVAFVLLGLGAVAEGSAGVWSARMLARAEAEEGAATEAEAVLDSLARLPSVTAGRAAAGRLGLEWWVERVGSASEVRLRVCGPDLARDEWFAARFASLPAAPGDAP
jgi:hypothetical protein